MSCTTNLIPELAADQPSHVAQRTKLVRDGIERPILLADVPILLREDLPGLLRSGRLRGS